MTSVDDVTRFDAFRLPEVEAGMQLPEGRAIAGLVGSVQFIISHAEDGLVLATLGGAAGKVGDGVVRSFFRHWGIPVPADELPPDMFTNPRLRGWVVRKGRRLS
jgi:hypothetical protein